MLAFLRAKMLAGASIAIALLVSSVPANAQVAGSWSQFGDSSAHNSYNADPSITASTATGMGIAWMANMYAADLGSPVVAYNAGLAKTVVYVGNERATSSPSTPPPAARCGAPT